MKLILTILSVLKWADGLLPFPQGTATGVSFSQKFILIELEQLTVLNLSENV